MVAATDKVSVKKIESMGDKEKKRGRPPHQTPSALARRANIHPVIRDLIAWRRQHRLSQVAAAQWAQARGLSLTASSIRMWEEGWRSPRPHTIDLLRRFLERHSKR
jgi:DNA-binding transcriptional regulator YiaG